MTTTSTESFGGDQGGFRPRRSSKFPRFAGKRAPVKPEEPLDYKNVAYLCKFLTPQGKIQSRKRTGFCSQCQRELKQAIKRARHLGLMPFVQ